MTHHRYAEMSTEARGGAQPDQAWDPAPNTQVFHRGPQRPPIKLQPALHPQAIFLGLKTSRDSQANFQGFVNRARTPGNNPCGWFFRTQLSAPRRGGLGRLLLG